MKTDEVRTLVYTSFLMLLTLGIMIVVGVVDDMHRNWNWAALVILFAATAFLLAINHLLWFYSARAESEELRSFT